MKNIIFLIFALFIFNSCSDELITIVDEYNPPYEIKATSTAFVFNRLGSKFPINHPFIISSILAVFILTPFVSLIPKYIAQVGLPF